MTIPNIVVRIKIIIDILICTFCGSIRSIAISSAAMKYPSSDPDCSD
ncbi:2990_t:CDS:2 [Dentiscutata heterogama]|uniref:2990_t:CDS:1 n=1 Tax=Dentiscutata heterogama TaxID=1316150 RepID=A0ACA9KWW3_9GLOM|nr:2990_t:CDS:2 [Dentiscutata heterogama]